MIAERWSSMRVEITATIANLRQVEWDSLGFNFVLIYDRNTMAPAPYSFMATVTSSFDLRTPKERSASHQVLTTAVRSKRLRTSR